MNSINYINTTVATVNRLRDNLPRSGPMCDDFLYIVQDLFHELECEIDNLQSDDTPHEQRLHLIEQILGLNSNGTFFTRMHAAAQELFGEDQYDENTPPEVLIINSVNEALEHLEASIGIPNNQIISHTIRLSIIEYHIDTPIQQGSFMFRLHNALNYCIGPHIINHNNND